MTEETTTTEAPTPAPAGTLPEIKVGVKKLIDRDQLKKDIEYSLTNLSGAMQNQAGLILHYGILAADAELQTDRLKLILEAREAAVYRLKRDQAVKEGGKFTDTQLSAAVSSEKDVIRLKMLINEAKQIHGMAKAAVEAFKHRTDMLVQHGSRDRVELQGELRTRVLTDASEAAKAGALATVQRLSQPQK
jgi:hypothetical protein